MTAQSEIPIDEAAQRLGTTIVATLMHIKRKRLSGHEVDGGWYVTAESLEAFLDDERGGAPHDCRGACGGCGTFEQSKRRK